MSSSTFPEIPSTPYDHSIPSVTKPPAESKKMKRSAFRIVAHLDLIKHGLISPRPDDPEDETCESNWRWFKLEKPSAARVSVVPHLWSTKNGEELPSSPPLRIKHEASPVSSPDGNSPILETSLRPVISSIPPTSKEKVKDRKPIKDLFSLTVRTIGYCGLKINTIHSPKSIACSPRRIKCLSISLEGDLSGRKIRQSVTASKSA